MSAIYSHDDPTDRFAIGSDAMAHKLSRATRKQGRPASCKAVALSGGELWWMAPGCWKRGRVSARWVKRVMPSAIVRRGAL